MSDTKEILDVFYSDIHQKERQIINKSGMYPFIDHLNGFQTEHIHNLEEEDLILLDKIRGVNGYL